jgi:hypothetical protein
VATIEVAAERQPDLVHVGKRGNTDWLHQVWSNS